MPKAACPEERCRGRPISGVQQEDRLQRFVRSGNRLARVMMMLMMMNDDHECLSRHCMSSHRNSRTNSDANCLVLEAAAGFVSVAGSVL